MFGFIYLIASGVKQKYLGKKNENVIDNKLWSDVTSDKLYTLKMICCMQKYFGKSEYIR